MKIQHIIGIVVIAIALGVIVSSSSSASKYVGFAEACEMEIEGEEAKVHVVGELKKDGAGNVVGLEHNPVQNPNLIKFWLVDEKNKEYQVICDQPPASMQDFLRAEKVVVIGYASKGKFRASKILMKCPSKYKETEVK